MQRWKKKEKRKKKRKKNLVLTRSYNIRWKTTHYILHWVIIYRRKTKILKRCVKSTLTASIGTKKISCSQLLLIKYTWFCRYRPLRCVLTQFQGGKTSAIILKKQLLLPINPGRVYKAISKQFGVHRSATTAANLPRSGRPSKLTPRSDCAMLREMTKTQ